MPAAGSRGLCGPGPGQGRRGSRGDRQVPGQDDGAGPTDPGAADEINARITRATERESTFAQADLVVEAIAEDLTSSRSSSAISTGSASRGILATTTSSLPIVDCAGSPPVRRTSSGCTSSTRPRSRSSSRSSTPSRRRRTSSRPCGISAASSARWPSPAATGPASIVNALLFPTSTTR
ncbi:MAG: hypothetical protein IPL94_09940 [Tetrasphaera sp.]|nr:hypothetical protein [Tetrasphaera sp.]